jgi:hypothetical protein
MTLLDRQQTCWDRVGVNKTFTHPLHWDRFREQVTSADRVLDYGCGYGRVACFISVIIHCSRMPVIRTATAGLKKNMVP